MTRKWYCATVKYTRENPEHFAAENLVAQGFEVYLPMMYYREEIGRKGDPRSRLRFRGYVFVAFDVDFAEYGAINNTRGVGELLCGNDEMRTPKAIRTGVIELLRNIEREEWATAAAKTVKPERNGLVPGAAVRITRHPNFEGQVGNLVGADVGLATVLVGSMMVTLPDCDIALAKADKRKRWAA